MWLGKKVKADTFQHIGISHLVRQQCNTIRTHRYRNLHRQHLQILIERIWQQLQPVSWGHLQCLRLSKSPPRLETIPVWMPLAESIARILVGTGRIQHVPGGIKFSGCANPQSAVMLCVCAVNCVHAMVVRYRFHWLFPELHAGARLKLSAMRVTIPATPRRNSRNFA